MLTAGAQEYKSFDWVASTIDIKSVEMEVKDEATKKMVFNGYRDGRITINANSQNPMNHSIDLKMSGYVEMSGSVVEFTFKKTTSYDLVQYTFQQDSQIGSLAVAFTGGKISFIVCTVDKNYEKPGTKKLTFTLRGFDVKSE